MSYSNQNQWGQQIYAYGLTQPYLDPTRNVHVQAQPASIPTQQIIQSQQHSHYIARDSLYQQDYQPPSISPSQITQSNLVEDDRRASLARSSRSSPSITPDRASHSTHASQSHDIQEEKTRISQLPFVIKLRDWLEKNGLSFRVPMIQGVPLDLMRLHEAVNAEGGFENVLKQRLWKSVSEKAGIKWTSSATSSALRRNYEKLLLPWEHAHRPTGSTVSMQSYPRDSPSVNNDESPYINGHGMHTRSQSVSHSNIHTPSPAIPKPTQQQPSQSQPQPPQQSQQFTPGVEHARLLSELESAGVRWDLVEQRAQLKGLGWAERFQRYWKARAGVKNGYYDQEGVFAELGTIDLAALAKSIRAGMDIQLTDALNTLLLLSFEPAPSIHLEHCPYIGFALTDTLFTLHNSLLKQFKAEATSKVDDDNELQMDDLFGTQLWSENTKIQKEMDRAVAILTILRNLSFHASNKAFLASLRTLSTLTSFTSLALSILSLADKTGYLPPNSYYTLTSSPKVAVTPTRYKLQFAFDTLEHLCTLYANVAGWIRFEKEKVVQMSMSVFDTACAFLDRNLWKQYIGSDPISSNRILGLNVGSLDTMSFTSLLSLAQLLVGSDNRGALTEFFKSQPGLHPSFFPRYLQRLFALMTDTLPRHKLPLRIAEEGLAMVEIAIYAMWNLTLVDGVAELLLQVPVRDFDAQMQTFSMTQGQTNGITRYDDSRTPYSSIEHTIAAGLSGLIIRLTIFASTTHIAMDKFSSVIPVLRRAMATVLELVTRTHRSLSRLRKKPNVQVGVGWQQTKVTKVLFDTVMEEHCDKYVKDLGWRALILLETIPEFQGGCS